MPIVLNIVVPVAAVLAFLVALLYLFRAFQKRTTSHSPFAYGVARQQTRHSMQANLFWAAGALLLAIVLLVVYLLRPSFGEPFMAVESPMPQLTPETVEEGLDGTPTSTSTPTLTPTMTAAPEVTSTAPVTPTLTPTPIATLTPEPRLAVVDSPNGLWLRAEPGVEGEQIENLDHLSLVTLLDGFVEVDELEWQEVLAPSGNQGWVAAAFLAYQD